MIASTVSAKIDGLRHPALFNSPSPNFKKSPTLISVPISLNVEAFTSSDRNLLRSPSTD
jgi:hypothetical protein